MTTERSLLVRLLIGFAKGTGYVGVLLLLVVGCWLVYAQIRISATETLPRGTGGPTGDRWVHAVDVDVHLREWGAKNAKPLLLVHGTGAWSGTWVSNADALAAAGYHVVALDLPPFGFTTLPANGDYSRHTQAKRILAVLEQMGRQPVTLLGHSFGGGPAVEAAMLDGSRIGHLVLLDAAIGLHAVPQAACVPSEWLQAVLSWRMLRTGIVAAVATEPAFSQFLLRRFVARKDVVTAARTAIYQQPFKNQDFSAGLGDWAYQFAMGCESPASVEPENFRRLKMPVSLVWGEQDSITPLVQAQQLQALVPGAQLTVLPGVGHIPQIEDVTLFNSTMARVLRSRP